MSTTEQDTLSRFRGREESYRLTIARLLDAIERYPDDIHNARMQGDAMLRREPLWAELDRVEGGE